MLRLSMTLLVIAAIAAVVAFGGIAGPAAGFAQLAFYLLIVFFVTSLLAVVVRRVAEGS